MVLTAITRRCGVTVVFDVARWFVIATVRASLVDLSSIPPAAPSSTVRGWLTIVIVSKR